MTGVLNRNTDARDLVKSRTDFGLQLRWEKRKLLRDSALTISRYRRRCGSTSSIAFVLKSASMSMERTLRSCDRAMSPSPPTRAVATASWIYQKIIPRMLFCMAFISCWPRLGGRGRQCQKLQSFTASKAREERRVKFFWERWCPHVHVTDMLYCQKDGVGAGITRR